MTDLIALGALLEDAETHGLVVNALESAAAEMRAVGIDSPGDRLQFDRVATTLDQVTAAMYATSTRASGSVETFADILADRGARETLRSALMMYGRAVVEVWETSTDVSVRGICEQTTANVEWALECIERQEDSPAPPA